ncbi:MAG: aldehyde dehydrogenase family protein, partial [Microbacterium sp.]|uniref:aldehyde dehydrogenase family protein n=1 Tax=Microbacterium sp. TaxID=51671 RepID=UPI003BB0DFCD
MSTVLHLINGAETGKAARTGDVFNPATGAVQRQVAFASEAEVAAAVAAAKAALPGWRSLSLIKRADVFFRLRQILADRTGELAAIVTDEHGKVLSDAAGEVSRGIENIE